MEEKFSFGHPESWNLVNASNHFYCLDQQLVPALQAYRIMELEPKCTDMLSTHAKALGQRAIVATCGYAKKNRSIHSLASFNSSGESSGNNSLFLHLVTFQTKKATETLGNHQLNFQSSNRPNLPGAPTFWTRSQNFQAESQILKTPAVLN